MYVCMYVCMYACVYARLSSMKDMGEGGLAYDAESASVIKLSNGFVLYLREVNKYAASEQVREGKERENKAG